MNLDSTPIDFSNAGLSFHKTCAQGNLSVVKSYFAQQGFDLNFDKDQESIHKFLYNCVTKILNNQDVINAEYHLNFCNNEGTTGFHLACVFGKLNVVKFFFFSKDLIGILLTMLEILDSMELAVVGP